MSTEQTELIARLRNDTYQEDEVRADARLAAAALEALQAENDSLKTGILNLALADKAALDRMTAERDALRARLAALEGQEPAHWRAVLSEDQRRYQLQSRLHFVGFGNCQSAEGWVASEKDFNGWNYTLEPLFLAAGAAPASADIPLALLERLSKTLINLGYATPEGGMEAFNAQLETQMYHLCSGVDSLLAKEISMQPASAAVPKSLAECGVGPCNCDPHIEHCGNCAPFLHPAAPQPPIAKPLTDEQEREEFEKWHSSTRTQIIERWGDTYENAHVRCRWEGWKAANGIKEQP